MSRLELIAGTGAAGGAGKKDVKKGKEEEGKTLAPAFTNPVVRRLISLISRK